MTQLNTLRRGFTLIELMITVAVIGILAGIALPIYTNYVLAGRVQEGLQALAAARLKMEQYFMDNRTYVSTGTTCGTGVGANQTVGPGTVGRFTITCTGTATAYTVTATGGGPLANFVYTINQDNTQTSTITKSGWGTGSTVNCWVNKAGVTC